MAGMIIVTGRERVRAIAALITLLLALPLNLGILTGFSLWFSPFIMLNSIFATHFFVALNTIGLAVLVLFFFRKRFFCRYICATGFCLDNLKPIKKSGKIIPNFPPAGEWLAIISLAAAVAGIPLLIIIDPAAIFNNFFSSFTGKISLITIITLTILPALLVFNIFFPGLWCSKICPLGGLQDSSQRMKEWFIRIKNKTGNAGRNYSPARRYFIAAGTGLIAGLTLPRILSGNTNERIRPPAALPEDEFNTLCIRCGNCIRSCPTKILTRSQSKDEFLSWLTPEVSFSESYCLETCNRCGQVCPTGSIGKFSLNEKGGIYMATAVIEYDRCLLLHNKECDRCKAACPYTAIRMSPSEEFLSVVPVVNATKCVGCGACAVICPAETIKMKPPGAS